MKMKLLNLLPIFLLLMPIVTAGTNLEVEIPPEFSSVTAGSKMVFTTKLLSLKDLGRRDVTLKYEILNAKNELVLTKSETVAVQTQASFVGNLELPTALEDGSYTLKITLLSEAEQNPETRASFSIISEEPPKNTEMYIYAGAVALGVIIVVLALLKSKTWLKHARLKSKIRRLVKSKISSK